MWVIQELLVSGEADFQPIKISLRAWNSALENAILIISSGITSSRTPNIQHIGSIGTFVWNTPLSVPTTSTGGVSDIPTGDG